MELIVTNNSNTDMIVISTFNRVHQRWIGIFQSRDDPLIPVSEARYVAARLGCSYFEHADRGHFVDPVPFPELVQFVRRKLALAEGT